MIGNRAAYHYTRSSLASKHVHVVMSIHEVQGTAVSSGQLPVTPIRFSRSGMQFVTPLMLPVNDRYSIRLQVVQRREQREIIGIVTGCQPVEGGYRYNCSFIGGQKLPLSMGRSWNDHSKDRSAANLFTTSGLFLDIVG